MGVTVAYVFLSRAQLPYMTMEVKGKVMSAVQGPHRVAIALEEGQFLGDPEIKARLVVTVGSEAPALERVRALTRLVASVVQASPAHTVAWQPSGVALPAETFLQLMPLLEQGPLTSFWVSIRTQGSSGRTVGLVDFDSMELEAVDCPSGAEAVEKYLYGLAEYLIEQGPVVKDGDSVGEGVRVVYSDSGFVKGTRVMRLVWE